MAAFDEGILSVSKPEKCGCQELLNKITLVHYGWLRRKCLRNALQIKYIKWPQQYVIIGEKCIYYFNSETSKHPEGAMSLYGFNRVIRASDVKTKEAIWAFKLEHIQPHVRSIYFAASSEREMVTWMQAFKAEMLNANNVQSKFKEQISSENVSDSSWDSGDYRDLEDSIYMEPLGYKSSSDHDDEDEVPESVNSEKPPLPPRPALYHSSDSELNVQTRTLQNRQNMHNSNRSASTEYTLRKSVTSEGKTFSKEEYRLKQETSPSSSESSRDSKSYWESIYFHGTKNKAAEVIKRIAENGVYLIRKSDDESNALLLYSHPGIKKFKIMEKENGQVFLSNNGPDFGTIEELVFYYYSNDLPNISIKLVTPYKLHADYQE